MPLDAQIPKLDSLTFEQLRSRALLRIPRYTPEWTDYNESDPGIALVELFAWLTDTMLYEMNRVPDRNYLTFLNNLGLELQQAAPATVYLAFTAAANADTQDIAQGTRFQAPPPGDGDPLIFETVQGLSLIRLPLEKVQVFDGVSFQVVTLPAPGEQGPAFRPFSTGKVGNALYLGFGDALDPVVKKPFFPPTMRLHVYLPPVAQTRETVRCLGDSPDAVVAAPVRLAWEYRPDDRSWKELSVFEDSSRAFTREGDIVVEGPKTNTFSGDPALVLTREGLVQDKPRYWLRVRVKDGAYPVGRPPQISALVPNVVAARNLFTVRNETLGFSNGLPDQVVQVRRRPVYLPVDSTTKQGQDDQPIIRVAEGEDDDVWKRQDDLLRSGPEDPHYVLDAATGQVRFGDGNHGRIPVAGVQIIADQYRSGGGKAGNTPANTVTPLTGLVGVDSVTNPRPATGGSDEQSLDNFKECAPSQLRHRNRAVSADDYRVLAEEVGGVAKAQALPLAHPDFPGVKVPGAISVVIVPDSDDLAPQPSQELREAVCRYLDSRRLLTTELYVTAPKYTEIRVEALVEADPYAAAGQVASDVKAAINRYLSPLQPKPTTGTGTSTQTGEPQTPTGGSAFGLDLYPTRLYEVILSVREVQVVSSLKLYVNGVQRDLKTPVKVEPDGLLHGSNNHMVEVKPYRDQ